MGKKDKSAASGKEHLVLGIDLGGTKILCAVVDQQGHVLSRSKRKTRAEKGIDAVIERITKTAREAVDGAGLKLADIAAIGIGAPGVANFNQGIIEFAPNLNDWVNVPLGPSLYDKLGVPVFVENDVNAGTYGEATIGAARDFSSVVGIFPGTGIGGGIMLDGKLWHGARNAAAEIGHMSVMIDGPVCGCGRRGCIEALASRTAIERDIIGEIRGGRASLITDMVDLNKDRITSGTLASAAKAGDSLTLDVLERASYNLGVFTGALVNALDPECIVYGGGLIEACEDIMMPIIREATYRYLIRPVAPKDLPILVASLGDDAVLLGAAMLASDVLNERLMAQAS